MTVIQRQEILQDISFFTATPKTKFYDTLFSHLDVSPIKKAAASTGRKGFSKEALLCAFIVMKCEGFSQITDLVDYLSNNLIVAHYCGFNIMKRLPSYWTFDRFVRDIDNVVLPSSAWIPPPLPQTQRRIILSRSRRISSAKIINQRLIPIAVLAFIPLPTSIPKRTTRSIGATRAMFWWIASPAYRFTR